MEYEGFDLQRTSSSPLGRLWLQLVLNPFKDKKIESRRVDGFVKFTHHTYNNHLPQKVPSNSLDLECPRKGGTRREQPGKQV